MNLVKSYMRWILLEFLLSKQCPLLQVCVCALGWVKYRKHISLLFILCIIVYVTNKKKKTISDYGKMLKYLEKYR